MADLIEFLQSVAPERARELTRERIELVSQIMAGQKRIAELEAQLSDLAVSPITFQDARVGYVEIQVDRLRRLVETAQQLLSEHEET